MRRALPLLVALCLPATARAEAERPQLEIGGFAAFDTYQYLQDHGDSVDTVAQIRFAPALRARYRFLRAVAQAELRHDFVDVGRGGRVILREAAVGLQHRGFRLQGGALLERWGKMDVASPTDNVVAWDYEELFFPEALPVPGVKVGYSGASFSISGIAVMAFVLSRYRHAAPSRFDTTWGLPQQQVVPTALGQFTFDSVYEQFADPQVTGEDSNLLRGWDAGLRADLFLPQVDVGLSFLATRDKLPGYNGFETINTGDSDGDGVPDHLQTETARLRITPYHPRLYVPGADLAVTAGPFVFKGEAAMFLTEDLEHADCLVDDPYLKASAGVELMLANVVGDMDLAVRAQYNADVELPRSGDDVANIDDECRVVKAAAGGVPTATDYEQGLYGAPHIRHPYSHAIYWNLRWDFLPQLALDVRGFVSFAGDVLVMPRVEATLAGHLRLTAGALLVPHTGADTFFADYARSNRVELGLRYDF